MPPMQLRQAKKIRKKHRILQGSVLFFCQSFFYCCPMDYGT